MTLARFGLGWDPPRGGAASPGARPEPDPAARVIADEPKPVPLGPADRPAFLRRVEEAADQVRAAQAKRQGKARPTALVFSDMDVDGITSHTIMRAALDRLGFKVEPLFSKKFSEDILAKLAAAPHDLVVVTDHGSPARGAFAGRNVLVLDHHKPPNPAEDHSHQLHPMLYGLNGSTEICSAGIAYLLARSLDPEGNRDLAAMGVIGSAGDMMDREKGRFQGLTSSEVLADAVRFGLVETMLDLRLYGRHGRSVTQLFAFADDPLLRGLSRNEEACRRFLTAQGVNPEERWVHLDPDLRGRIVGHLLERASDPSRLLGECYEIRGEPVGGHLRDVREYSTVINGSSRYEMPETVVAVLMGDRGRRYEEALDNYLNHKRNIVQAIQLVHSLGVTQGTRLQWFHVRDKVRHTIVGSVAGAVQSRHHPDKPMIAFAVEADDRSLVKVSGRGHRALVNAGLDLSRVMREAAAALGGKGGGHDIAAGATIPAGKEADFLAHAERILEGQIPAPQA